MAPPARLGALLVSALALVAVAPAQAASSTPPLVNWSAPATYSPSQSSKIRALTDISSPVPFITTAPCRQYNSLLATPLLQGVNRAVPLTGAPCGIPTGAVAVSVNVTVFNITGATGNGVFKVDTVTPPVVAWINYPPTEAQRGNAGVVALNGSGQIIVQVAQGTGQVDFIVDVNGYYASTPAVSSSFFRVVNSGQYAILGQTDSSSNYTAGVYGCASATTGMTYGVWGDDYSTSTNGIGVLGISHAATGQTYGVYGQTNSTSNGAVGTYGEALGTTGVNYGVQGRSSSGFFGAAGVLGLEASGDPGGGFLPPAGVLGASVNAFGVLGKSRDAGSGVFGASLTTAGGVASSGYLGFNNSTGVYYNNGLSGTGTKNFVEPHPTDATKLIKYVSIEGREAGVYFRGRGQARKGLATIDVPEDFRMVASEEGLSIQVTPIGETANVAVTQIDLNRIVVKATRDVEFFYTVNGVRKAYPTWNPIQENGKEFVPEGPDARLPAYLSANETHRLIDNGTYNADGTVNMGTAERAGWVKAWADREAETRAAVREARRAVDAKRR